MMPATDKDVVARQTQAGDGPSPRAARQAVRSGAGPLEPAWAGHMIAWQVFPLGALGCEALCPPGDPDDPSSPAGQAASRHRLRRLARWLDHVVRLGVNTIQLGPVFHSMSHGYDTVDYLRVDPRLGVNEDLTALIAAAHERGIRVLLDGVFNHTGIAYPAFARLVEAGPHSPEAAMYHLTWPADASGAVAWEPGQAPSDYQRFEGQDWLPQLNHQAPAVADLVTEVMTTWCERGVDGWRLDAAYAVDPVFWQRVLPRVRERFPEVYMYGEVIHGDYGRLVRGSAAPMPAGGVGRAEAASAGPAGAGPADTQLVAGMNAVTQYELWQATWHALAEANLYELDWCLRRHAALLDGSTPPGSEPDAAAGATSRTSESDAVGFVPWTFLSNHDTTRIATQLASGSQGSPAPYLPHAIALLALLPGTPCVYYGDEEGWAGLKEHRLGGDDAVRPPLPAHAPETVAGSGTAGTVAPGGERTDEAGTAGQAGGARTLDGLDPERVRALYQELLGLRRRLPWLHDATMRALHLDNRLYALELTARQGSAAPTSPDPAGTGGEGQTQASDGVVLALSLEEHEAWLPTGGAHHVLAHGSGADLALASRRAGTATPPRPVRDGVVVEAGGWAVLSRPAGRRGPWGRPGQR